MNRLKKDYYGAVAGGYFALGANVAVQLLLVPMYLEHLGKEQFGVLSLLLALINYAAIGVGWVSGGFQRILNEEVSRHDVNAFSKAYSR